MAIQFSSVTQSCLTLCDPMDCSMPGLPSSEHDKVFKSKLYVSFSVNYLQVFLVQLITVFLMVVVVTFLLHYYIKNAFGIVNLINIP